MSKKDKGRIPPFVPLLVATLDSKAWRQMSHGAQMLYVALKRRAPNYRNRAFLSYRHAIEELRTSPRKIREWFKELEHYGFIVLDQHGCLGVDGKGKAPLWRLTEKGIAGQENPTNDFLRWDGTPFDPTPHRQRKKQNPATYGGNTPLPTGVTVPLPTGVTPESQSVTYGVHIGGEEGVTHGGYITSLTTRGCQESLSPSALESPSEPASTNFGPSDDPYARALLKWGRNAQRKEWSKPTILSDEPRSEGAAA